MVHVGAARALAVHAAPATPCHPAQCIPHGKEVCLPSLRLPAVLHAVAAVDPALALFEEAQRLRWKLHTINMPHRGGSLCLLVHVAQGQCELPLFLSRKTSRSRLGTQP